MAEPVTLRTGRLVLRPWRATDREAFAELNADPEVMEHFPATLSRAESDAFADRIEADLDAQGWGLWAVEIHDGPDGPVPFVGFVGLAHPGFDPSMVEVGWRLSRSAWGHGYASEGALAALRFAFEELGLAEVVSFTTEGNGRSRAVMERIGLVHRPERDFDHPGIDPGARPELVRHVLYSTSRDVRGAGPAGR